MLVKLNVDVNDNGEVVVVYSDPIDDGSPDINLDVYYSEEALKKKVRIDY